MMNQAWSWLLLAVLLASLCLVHAEINNFDTEVEMSEEAEGTDTPPFTPPESDAFFSETFTSGWDRRWTLSRDPQFASGRWLVERSQVNAALPGEEGLIVSEAARHHAIAAEFPKGSLALEEGLAVSYDVRFHRNHECGGAYLKLLSTPSDGDFDIHSFNAATPYTIMFGPDKCGSNDKVHFIVRFPNPISGEVNEHHLKAPPTIRNDRYTHNYAFFLTNDNKLDMVIDGVSVKQADLLNDFEPPINPPKEIDDPKDKKPIDWVDEAKISDPDDVKPDDWDESEPQFIDDLNAVKPQGWLDEGPSEIPDPQATKPAEWDDEVDGEYEPPTIPNPICSSIGCGEWTRPKLKNPKYKGKWTPKKIDNPDYKGPWAPRKIPNPHYFEESNPISKLRPISAVGIEIWTMQRDLEFDNIIIDHADEKGIQNTKKFIELTYGAKHAYEEKMLGKAPSTADKGIVGSLMENTAVMIVTGVIALVVVIVFVICCCFNDKPTHPGGVTNTAQRHMAHDSDDENEPEHADDENADMNGPAGAASASASASGEAARQHASQHADQSEKNESDQSPQDNESLRETHDEHTSKAEADNKPVKRSKSKRTE